MTDVEYIQSLLKEKESSQIAFFDAFDNERIAETVCAFLNTQGGRILVGVSPSKEVLFGGDIQPQFQQLRRFIYDSISPESLIGIRPEAYNNNSLVLIEVIEGTKKPYSINNHSFVRSNAETRIADDNEMSNLIRARRTEEYSWENSPALEATLDDLDKEE